MHERTKVKNAKLQADINALVEELDAKIEELA